MIKINILVKYFLICFVITLLLFILGIPILRKKHFGQYVRKLGPKSHFRKEGTPTMGGVYIIIGVLISFGVFIFFDNTLPINKIFLLLMPLVLYGVLGFLDDYKKVSEKKNDGIKPKTKMFFQIIWATIYFFLLLDVNSTSVKILSFQIDLKWLYGVLILLMFVSTSNAFNLVDGMDGLAGGLAIIILCGLLIITDNENIQVFIIITLAALFAFMCYNFNKALVFMGDVGSMAIGATIANLFIITKNEFLLMIFGIVLIVETLSVIIQVGYFKITKGKRLFLMTPLHHHFELKGYNEKYIVIGFYIFQIIVVIIGLIYYFGG